MERIKRKKGGKYYFPLLFFWLEKMKGLKMKVKIGKKIYDSKEEPIMLILTDYNKKHISDMSPDNFKYCEYPENMSAEQAMTFMREYDEK